MLRRRDEDAAPRRAVVEGEENHYCQTRWGQPTAYNLLPLLALLVSFEEGRWWCWWDFAAIFHSHQASTRGQRRGSLFQHWTWSGLRLKFTDQEIIYSDCVFALILDPLTQPFPGQWRSRWRRRRRRKGTTHENFISPSARMCPLRTKVILHNIYNIQYTSLSQLAACPHLQAFSKFCRRNAYVVFFATFATKMP